MALVYLLSTLDKVPHITIRCIRKILLDQDEDALQEIKAVVGDVTTIRFCVGNRQLGEKEDTIEIVDECDATILDDDKFADVYLDIGTLIGFTATPLKGTEHSSEKELLSALGI